MSPEAFAQCRAPAAVLGTTPSWEAQSQWDASAALLGGPPPWEACPGVDAAAHCGMPVGPFGGCQVALTGCTLPPPPSAPPLAESVVALEVPQLPETPRGLASSDGPASPLVLPDVLPAESRQAVGSGCDAVGEMVSADVSLDAGPWPPVAIATATLVPPAWPSAQWLSSGEAVLLSPCSMGADLPLPKVLEDGMVVGDGPQAPSTPSAASCGGSEKENMYGVQNIKEGVPVLELHKVCPPRELDTPPPKSSSSRWAFRADAPCFVPREVFADSPTTPLPGDSTPAGSETPEKVGLPDTDFVAARLQMLRLRPENSPKRQLSAVALRAATAAFESGQAAMTPPPVRRTGVEASQSGTCLLELFGGEGSRSPSKIESRAQIRANAASARAHLAQVAAFTETAEKDFAPSTPVRGSRRNQRTRAGRMAGGRSP